MPAGLTTTGLVPLVAQLKGPLFRDANRELRSEALDIARGMEGPIADAVRRSRAPQAAAVAQTVRAHRDRVPAVVIGRVVPRISGLRGKRRRRDPEGNFVGSDPKKNRGSIAHGVIYGPLGGHRATSAHENYYRIGRDNSGGPVGRGLAEGGHLFDLACAEYWEAFKHVLTRHGFAGDPPAWRG